MIEPRNRVVRVSHFGDPEGLEVVDAPLPTAGWGEVGVRVLASSLQIHRGVDATCTHKRCASGRRL